MYVRVGLAVIVLGAIAEIAAWFTVLFGIPTRTPAPQKLQV